MHMKPYTTHAGIPIYVLDLKGDGKPSCFFLWYGRMVEIPEKDVEPQHRAEYNKTPEKILVYMARSTIEALLELLRLGALDEQGYMVRQMTKEEIAKEQAERKQQ